MDVRCGRCGTEYEFDDALISERGTTVKCTNCGYQFKVFPPRSHGQPPEQWVVRTMSGEELIFTTIRDLQRSISNKRIGPDDVLSRGVEPPRPLSAIAELQPFLHTRTEPPKVPRTLFGVAPPANSSGGGAGPPSGVHAQHHAAPPRPGAPFRQERATPALGSTELIPPVSQPSESQQPSAPGASVPSSGVRQSTRPGTGPGETQVLPPPQGDSQGGDVGRTHPATPGAMRTSEQVAFAATVRPADDGPREAPMSVEPATLPRTQVSQNAQTAPLESDAPSAASVERSGPGTADPNVHDDLRGLPFRIDDETDPHYSQAPPRRRARSRWVVLVVVLGAGVLMAATVGRRYIEKYTTKAAHVAPKSDARVEKLLSAGRRLMAEGDLEGAKEELTKANALASQDPQVIAALAEVEVVRADLLWLKLRLLDPKDVDYVARTHRELGAAVGRAERAVTKALQGAAGQPAVLRARVDVERMKKNLDQARKLVGPVTKNASLPENAYVLAALDLAESEPAWSSVLHRLRTAASAEGELGRARAALVYALARSGRSADAELELEKLTKASPDHPLLIELKGFVARHAQGSADAGSDAAAEVAEVDPDALPGLDTSESGQAAEDEASGGDFRAQLVSAENALRGGNLSEAERLYRSVLRGHPGNTEALSGLGDVAAKRNDPKQAAAMYDQVLAANPNYLPALVASADQKWAGGDKRGAAALYRRIASQAGAGSSYAAKAQRRIAEFERGEGSRAAAEPDKPSGPAPEPAPEPEKPADDAAPHIDTTDLPEFNQ